MERNEEISETPEASGAKNPEDPQDTTPRGNPPVDEEALAKSEEVLSRVKPY